MLNIKVILVVHIYGRRVDMDKVHAIAEKYGLYVIEDLAEAHGVRPHPKTHAAIHSFYKNKVIAGEEGGAVWFRNPDHAKLARQLRSMGFTDSHDFMHIPRGYNYRMSNAHAHLILKSLQLYPENLKMRQEGVLVYNRYCPEQWLMPVRNVLWVYDIRIPNMTSEIQGQVVQALWTRCGVQARHAFKPMSIQPEYKDCKVYGMGNATKFSKEVIYLPLTPGLVSREGARKAFEIIQMVVDEAALDMV